ncbi:MAG: cytochrome c biogenesis heme-transporting ATPase CcmA [Xanthomonadaceae bacterium]|nr:cytochrome c biogenesis heme-transporting ATPase CcmA [Xanthomonadaceae bacterium]
MKNTGGSVEISVHGLTCRRGGRELFSGLEWQVSGGAVVTVRGPNGAGKTSLLRLLAGLALPDAGEVRWAGTPIRADRARFNRDVAWVGHADGVKADLSPRENLAFHRALLAAPAASVDAALDAFGLARAADTPCRMLSAGQRRRTALARLLLAHAALWILDEPMAALDADGQQLVEALVVQHAADGGIAVVTSHQPLATTAPGIQVALG